MLKRMKNYVNLDEEELRDKDSEEEEEFQRKKYEDNKKRETQFISEYQEDEISSSSESEEDMPIRLFHCIICNKKLYSEIDYNNHSQSTKHLKTQRNAILAEIKEAKSFKKFLINKNFVTKFRTKHNKIKEILYRNSLRNMISLPLKEK